MQYLHDKQYYIDRYDLQTINECIDNIRMLQAASKKIALTPQMKRMPQEELDRNLNLMMNRYLFMIKGLRFKNREKTIEEWINQDKAKQDKLDNSTPPRI